MYLFENLTKDVDMYLFLGNVVFFESKVLLLDDLGAIWEAHEKSPFMFEILQACN